MQIAMGLRIYFDKALPQQLLYASELEQADEVLLPPRATPALGFAPVSAMHAQCMRGPLAGTSSLHQLSASVHGLGPAVRAGEQVGLAVTRQSGSAVGRRHVVAAAGGPCQGGAARAGAGGRAGAQRPVRRRAPAAPAPAPARAAADRRPSARRARVHRGRPRALCALPCALPGALLRTPPRPQGLATLASAHVG